MSIRSNMSSVRTLPSSFPEPLRRVLEARANPTVCPAEVAGRLLSMPFFQKTSVKEARTSAKPTNRFANLLAPVAGEGDGLRRFANGGAGGPSSQWRPAYSSSADRGGEHRGGEHRGGEHRGGEHRGGEHRGDHRSEHRNDYRGDHRADRRDNRTDDGFQVWSTRRPVSRQVPAQAPVSVQGNPAEPESELSGPKFSSAAVKSSGETEDRILAKVKGKINKLGPMNYEATKTFMQQILDSDETEFLDEFMKFIFQKAATESAFCPLYAKLLHELADQFTHLRVVMTNIFRDYTAIFVEVETTPDVGTEDYKAFVQALERKKFRRGYSQFVAELVKLGEADLDAFSELVQQIVSVLETSYTSSTNTLICEEYIDCLANMCNSAPKILSNASWSDGVKGRLQKLTKIPRSDAPGLTNKGRFALMDLVDFANRGWK